MSAIQAFFGRVAPFVIGCPDPIINQAIIDTCIHFCEMSMIDRRRLDAVQTSAGSQSVDIDLPPSTRAVRVLNVQLDGVNIEAAPDHVFNAEVVINGTVGKPMGYMYSDGALLFYPTPDATYTVSVQAALKPLRSSTTVDDKLFEDWADAIASGSIARLMAMPADWANGPLAALYQTAYTVGLNRAMLESSREKTRAILRVEPVRI